MAMKEFGETCITRQNWVHSRGNPRFGELLVLEGWGYDTC
jgi:hypothetical protein